MTRVSSGWEASISILLDIIVFPAGAKTQNACAGRNPEGCRAHCVASAGWFWVRRKKSCCLRARRPRGDHGLQACSGQSCLTHSCSERNDLIYDPEKPGRPLCSFRAWATARKDAQSADRNGGRGSHISAEFCTGYRGRRMNMPLFSLSFLAVHFENRQTILIVHPK